MSETLLLSACLSFFCIGLYVSSGEGMILEFIRKPYENLKRYISEREMMNKPVKKQKILKKILMPIIGCPICYSSFWTLVWSLILFGEITATTFLVIFIVAGMNKALMNWLDL